MKLFAWAILFLAFTSPSFAQSPATIKGTVIDLDTKEPLPAANIHILGTYRGTITNGEGQFDLRVATFPSDIVFRFIGYQSDTLHLAKAPVSPLEIQLEPSRLELPEVVVTGEDPAIQVMREVIARKPEWREKLQTYKANAYTRQSLRSDTAIASITESVSIAYWDKEKGPKEVIVSKRQTKNMEASNNFAGASYIPNFYDDNLEITEFEMVGPTHPDALKFYNFKLLEFEYIDNDLIYVIEVTPRKKLQPTFEGTIRVLVDKYALIDVELRPSKSMMFPPPIQKWDLYYRQQFSNFGGDFWLPVDVRIKGTIGIGFPGLKFPDIGFDQLSSLSDYEVNVELPDSLYKENSQILVDSVKVNSSDFALANREPIPLSLNEKNAYATIDTNDTIEKALKPTGALSRFIEMEDEEESEADKKRRERRENRGPVGKFLTDATIGFKPYAHYNRVDEAYVGLNYERTFKKQWVPLVKGAYSTGQERFAYGAGLRYQKRSKFFRNVEVGYYEETKSRTQSTNYNLFLASSTMLFGTSDYFDLYWNKEWNAKSQMYFKKAKLYVTPEIKLAEQNSLSKSTDYDIPGIRTPQRENPGINDGRMNSVKVTIKSREDYVPFGFVGQENFELSIEHSSDAIGSDFNFTQARFRGDARFETFYRRRFLPNVIDVRVEALGNVGDLPFQRFGGIDGSLSYFGPFGSFRSATSLPIQAQQYAAIFWEHNFRTIPFELLGLRFLTEKGTGLVVFGNHAVVDFPEQLASQFLSPFKPTNQIHEIGVGINSLFSFMRADVTFRIDQPAVFFTLTGARIF